MGEIINFSDIKSYDFSVGAITDPQHLLDAHDYAAVQAKVISPILTCILPLAIDHIYAEGLVKNEEPAVSKKASLTARATMTALGAYSKFFCTVMDALSTKLMADDKRNIFVWARIIEEFDDAYQRAMILPIELREMRGETYDDVLDIVLGKAEESPETALEKLVMVADVHECLEDARDDFAEFVQDVEELEIEASDDEKQGIALMYNAAWWNTQCLEQCIYLVLKHIVFPTEYDEDKANAVWEEIIPVVDESQDICDAIDMILGDDEGGRRK